MRRTLITIGIVVAFVVGGTLTLALLNGHSPAAAAVRGVSFHFASEFPHADSSTYVMDEKGVEEFRSVLDEYGIDPATYERPNSDVCPGADWVEADVTFSNRSPRHLRIDACMTGEGSFEQTVGGGVFGFYALDHITENYPNSAITSITFRQSQAVDGWDYATYTQGDPAEIDRFTSILDKYSLVWSERASYRETIAVNPCADAIVTHVTVDYDGVNLQEGPLPFDACRNHDELTLRVTELFREWREALA